LGVRLPMVLISPWIQKGTYSLVATSTLVRVRF